MERESFEDEEVAKLLNEHFVCIKVDREERPDIDNIYMSVCQVMTGSGGWPLTIIMTPDKAPFFAATYIPKKARYGRDGMIELIPHVSNIWKNNKDKIKQATESIKEFLHKNASTASKSDLKLSVLDDAYKQFYKRFDENEGVLEMHPNSQALITFFSF